MIPRERPPFFGPRRMRWRNVRLRDVVALTLPIWLALAFVWGGAWLRFLETSRFDDWWSRHGKLHRLVEARLATLAALPEAMALRLRLDPEAGDPAVVRILVDRGAWARWQSEPLALHDAWVEASLVHGNDFTAAEIRKRGDTSVHWLTPKKSMTVKTGRWDPYKGHRRLVLSGKTPLEQAVTESLAADYGLLAPETHLAPVFVNGRFYGLFRLVEDVDESFLRAHGRLPGNIFRGDTAERGEAHPGLPRGLFQNLAIWDRVARNGRPTAPPGSALARLLRAVAGGSFADHQRLLALVDREEGERLFAYLLVTGDPYHMTNVHNQYWYEDPSSGRLHPIPRDIRLRDLAELPVMAMNDAFRALLRDPRIFDGALRVLAARTEEGTLLGGTEARLEGWEHRFGDALRFERLREGEISPVSTGEAILARLADNVAQLRGWLADARAEALVAPAGTGPQVVDLRVTGRAAVELVAVTVGPGEPPQLLADRDRDGLPGEGDEPLAAVLEEAADGTRRLVLERPLRLLPGLDTSASTFEPAPLPYRLFATGPGGRAAVRGLVLRNAHTGEAVVASPLAPGTALDEGPSWHPWRFAPPAPRTRRLAGEVRLETTLRLGPHETLVIAPGTTLRLEPGVSILSRGRVLAQGRADRPIRILPARAGRPWGALVLQGPEASGSRFVHVEIAGGSCATLDGVEYKGMVDVHHARDVRFEHARLAENLRCDDALNAVHAEVDLLASRFERVNADAADYDFSTGRICGSTFEQSGNDAVDLMTSAPWIEGNRMRGSGDKGVSVGERSAPWLVDNRIEGCALGVEVKDASEPWMVANRLRDNAVGVHQKWKNWRYGEGGFARWVGPPLVSHEADGASRLALADPADAADPRWALAPPRALIRFEDGFEPPRDGFVATTGRGRLARRRGDLVLSLRGRAASVEAPLDWDLAAADAPSRIVVQVASTALRALHLELEDAAGRTFRARLPRTTAPDRYALAVLEPPPARYRRLRLEAQPGGANARVRLHEVRWVVPSDTPARACPPWVRGGDGAPAG